MRIVLDTNVLIAAYATEGACMRLFLYCAKHHSLVVSEVLLDELGRKLRRKLRIAEPDVLQILAAYREICEVVDPAPLSTPVSRDPDDDWVLATAKSGRCECVVTGDGDLLSLGSFGSITILSPRTFSDRVMGQLPPTP